VAGPTVAPVVLPTQTNCAAASDDANIGAVTARPVASRKPRSAPPESALVASKPARPPAGFRLVITSSNADIVASIPRGYSSRRMASEDWRTAKHGGPSEPVDDWNSVRWRTCSTILFTCDKSATKCPQFSVRELDM
jgi:hypothetical protein